jgi:hypothetical protein
MNTANAVASELTAPTQMVEYLTLSQAAKILPRINGNRIHTSTLYRWTQRIKGPKLRYLRIGRKIVTTESWMQQFFCALATADTAQSDRQHAHVKHKRRPRPAQRKAEQNEAETILRKAKILV